MASVSLSGLSVLVVEDEPLLRKRYVAFLAARGAEVAAASSLREARNLAESMGFDLVLLDVHLPDGRGTALLAEGACGEAAVIVMTAEGGVAGAVEAMRLGAADYLTKPFDVEELPLRVARARGSRARRRADEHARAQEEGAAEAPPEFFFGQALEPVRQQLERILAADRRLGTRLPPVLIEGETGTGKSTVARWIHRRGPRASGPLLEVNCSALPETLAESELFGHEKGAFTDAKAARLGLFEASEGGTLFLDELPSLPAGLQAKVLTAIEDQVIRRIGSTRGKPVDVRIIAATQADLRQEVAAGRFREDLRQRLDLFRVRLPPLRERGDDIVPLAVALLAGLARRYRMEPQPIPESGRRRLRRHRWVGNVRELAHELERALVFADGDLEFAHLGPGDDAAPSDSLAGVLREDFRLPESGFSLEALTATLVERALAQAGGNVSAAARLLGVTRDFIRYRLKDRGEGEA